MIAFTPSHLNLFIRSTTHLHSNYTFCGPVTPHHTLRTIHENTFPRHVNPVMFGSRISTLLLSILILICFRIIICLVIGPRLCCSSIIITEEAVLTYQILC